MEITLALILQNVLRILGLCWIYLLLLVSIPSFGGFSSLLRLHLWAVCFLLLIRRAIKILCDSLPLTIQKPPPPLSHWGSNQCLQITCFRFRGVDIESNLFVKGRW